MGLAACMDPAYSHDGARMQDLRKDLRSLLRAPPGISRALDRSIPAKALRLLHLIQLCACQRAALSAYRVLLHAGPCLAAGRGASHHRALIRQRRLSDSGTILALPLDDGSGSSGGSTEYRPQSRTMVSSPLSSH